MHTVRDLNAHGMPYLMRELSSCFSRKHLFPFTVSVSHYLGLNHCDVP